jgi:HK97 gp10 family phage protein
MRVEGLAELEAKLNALPAAASKKVMRSALMFALTPMQKAARAGVAKRSGALAKAIAKRSFITKSNNYQADAGIVMNTKKKASGWRWHFEEFGTSRQKARPFLRPAFDSNKESAVTRFVAQIKKRIAAELKKARK